MFHRIWGAPLLSPWRCLSVDDGAADGSRCSRWRPDVQEDEARKANCLLALWGNNRHTRTVQLLLVPGPIMQHVSEAAIAH